MATPEMRERRRATPEMRARRRAYPLTNIEHQAYCVMQWLSGVTHREIAAQFGYASSMPVTDAIMRFNSAMDAWDFTRESYHGESKDAARRALAKFLAERAAQTEGTDGTA